MIIDGIVYYNKLRTLLLSFINTCHSIPFCSIPFHSSTTMAFLLSLCERSRDFVIIIEAGEGEGLIVERKHRRSLSFFPTKSCSTLCNNARMNCYMRQEAKNSSNLCQIISNSFTHQKKKWKNYLTIVNRTTNFCPDSVFTF